MEKYLQQLLEDIAYATANVASPYAAVSVDFWDWISDEEEDKTAPRIPLEEWTGIQQSQLPPVHLLTDEQIEVLYTALEKMLIAYNYAIIFIFTTPIRTRYEVLQVNFSQEAIQKRWHDGFFETCKIKKSHPDCLLGEACHCAYFEELHAGFIEEDLSPEEERLRYLAIEVAHIKRKYGSDWRKYYPYHLDPEYDDEYGNPHDYGFGDLEDDEDDWWRK